jgi:hypothetical protein
VQTFEQNFTRAKLHYCEELLLTGFHILIQIQDLVQCLEGYRCKVHINTSGGSIKCKWGPKSAIWTSGENIHTQNDALGGDRICRVNKVRLRGEAPGSFFYLPSTPLLWVVIINFQLRLCTRVCTFYRDQPVESGEKKAPQDAAAHTQKTKSYPGLPPSSITRSFTLLRATFEKR